MKVNDEKQKRKNSAVLIFKKYDCDIMGKITRQDFQLMYRDLVRQQFTKSDSDEIIQYLDATGTGFIEFNDYMQWVDEV
jgi:Ca2+-binding EF-hand superfamily protein